MRFTPEPLPCFIERSQDLGSDLLKLAYLVPKLGEQDFLLFRRRVVLDQSEDAPPVDRDRLRVIRELGCELRPLP